MGRLLKKGSVVTGSNSSFGFDTPKDFAADDVSFVNGSDYLVDGGVNGSTNQ